MPQLKQPMRLEEMTIRGFYNRYVGKCQKWMQVLSEADKRNDWANVLSECRPMEDEISKLPPAILRWLSPRLAKKFQKLIRAYGYENSSSLKIWPWALKARIERFKAVFRSVLTRYVEKLDTRGIPEDFVHDVIGENLDAVPGLLELHLHCRCSGHSRLLAAMADLENLQIFTHLVHCTDNIIAQLQRHCPHLTELVVTNSWQVTNASVQPLREARKLKFLDLYGTQIDDEHYGLLLSELPNIANITFRQKKSSISCHIAVESLDTITHVDGCIPDIDTVTHKCPNITSITVCQFPSYVSVLRAFVLGGEEISQLDYVSSSFNTVLQSVGHRLTDLKLVRVRRVDLQDIITLSPSLINLYLIACSFLNLQSDTPLDPQLPHFRHLINLKIYYLCEYPGDISYIRYYVSLKTIDLVCTRSFTVEFVTEILNLGTYKQLEVLRVEEYLPDAITVKALELLIGHCPLLKRIELGGNRSPGSEYVFGGNRGPGLEYVFGELKHRILLQNFDLKFKLKDKIVLSDYERYTNFY
jgi:hypothetical protein